MIDLNYLAKNVAELSGLPIRIYENGAESFRAFPVALAYDPAVASLPELLSIDGHVGYYVTPRFQYYGIVDAGASRLIVGPTSEVLLNEQQLRELAFQIDVPKPEVPAFLDGMRSIRRFPVERLLELLTVLNHVLNHGEKRTLQSIAIFDSEQELLKTAEERDRTERLYSGNAGHERFQSTLSIEETLMDIVRRGNSAALKAWLREAPSVQGGTVAGDQLRQLKNTFIVIATLTSRAAIHGGMRERDAFLLSDRFIQQVELLNTQEKILNLQYHMLTEFTEQVEKLRRDQHVTKLSLDVANYVQAHLFEPIHVERMAEEFYLSRPYLSSRFREETGQTLTDFILNEKTEEAKRLLRYSDKSASAIAAYLGFSSHSHFCRVFRKYAGVTPNEYREKHLS